MRLCALTVAYLPGTACNYSSPDGLGRTSSVYRTRSISVLPWWLVHRHNQVSSTIIDAAQLCVVAGIAVAALVSLWQWQSRCSAVQRQWQWFGLSVLQLLLLFYKSSGNQIKKNQINTALIIIISVISREIEAWASSWDASNQRKPRQPHISAISVLFQRTSIPQQVISPCYTYGRSYLIWHSTGYCPGQPDGRIVMLQ